GREVAARRRVFRRRERPAARGRGRPARGGAPAETVARPARAGGARSCPAAARCGSEAGRVGSRLASWIVSPLFVHRRREERLGGGCTRVQYPERPGGAARPRPPPTTA